MSEGTYNGDGTLPKALAAITARDARLSEPGAKQDARGSDNLYASCRAARADTCPSVAGVTKNAPDAQRLAEFQVVARIEGRD
jgi:hypothetical protein